MPGCELADAVAVDVDKAAHAAVGELDGSLDDDSVNGKVAIDPRNNATDKVSVKPKDVTAVATSCAIRFTVVRLPNAKCNDAMPAKVIETFAAAIVLETNTSGDVVSVAPLESRTKSCIVMVALKLPIRVMLAVEFGVTAIVVLPSDATNALLMDVTAIRTMP